MSHMIRSYSHVILCLKPMLIMWNHLFVMILPWACLVMNVSIFLPLWHATCWTISLSHVLFAIMLKCLLTRLPPIAFSHFGDVSFSLMDLVPSFTLHSDHPHMSYYPIDFDVFGDVQMKRHFMMDDVFIYRAHNFFICCLVCDGNGMMWVGPDFHGFVRREGWTRRTREERRTQKRGNQTHKGK